MPPPPYNDRGPRRGSYGRPPPRDYEREHRHGGYGYERRPDGYGERAPPNYMPRERVYEERGRYEYPPAPYDERHYDNRNGPRYEPRDRGPPYHHSGGPRDPYLAEGGGREYPEPRGYEVPVHRPGGYPEPHYGRPQYGHRQASAEHRDHGFKRSMPPGGGAMARARSRSPGHERREYSYMSSGRGGSSNMHMNTSKDDMYYARERRFSANNGQNLAPAGPVSVPNASNSANYG